MSTQLIRHLAVGLLVIAGCSSAADKQLDELKGYAQVERDESQPGKPVVGLWLTNFNETTKKDADSTLERLKGLTSLKRLALNETNVTDKGLEHFKGFVNLQTLDLAHTGVTDEGLSHLAGLTKLESLNLESTKLTDKGLEHLKGLTNLQTLILTNATTTNAITAEGVESLKGLTKLSKLDLRGLQLTGDALVPLKDFESLRSLDLGFNNLTDEGLRHLAGMKNLQELNLCENWGISDEGLKHLEGLTELRSLDIRTVNTQMRAFVGSQNHVTDKGLDSLVKLNNLEQIDLAGTHVTEAGVKKLQQALPKAKIKK